jgi:hypothetical protein
MQLPTLYKRTKTGAITQWTIEAKDGATRTVHGQVGGKLVTSQWYKAETTNAGRANQRDPQEQAEAEAKSIWKKREEKNYFTDINEIDNLVFREPMRAKKWKDENKGKKKVKFPVYVQPKLDGCLSKDTLVHTDIGLKSLHEIVDLGQASEVLSFNESTGKSEMRKILNRMKNFSDIKETSFQWYSLELEDGTTIKITGNHLVYLPKLKCWRRVDELDENDTYLLKS